MTRLERPIVCLVTDRQRLVEAGKPAEAAQPALVSLAREAAAAGVRLLQVRERDLEPRALSALVAEIVEVARGSEMAVVVNDRLDVALTSGAHGVHLRGDSIAPSVARAIAPPGFLIGRSVHSLEEAREHAAAADYLIAGTVFPTSSKASATRLLQPDGLREIAAAVEIPVIAIGGITLDRLDAVVAAGAAGIAGIGLFLPGGLAMSRVVAAARARFDSLPAASYHSATP